MKPVDFSHLMAKAEKVTLKKGTKLAIEGGKNSHVHLIFSGHMSVMKNHHFIARLGHNQFVGEMSFLRWQHRKSFSKDSENSAKPASAAHSANSYGGEESLESDVLQAQSEMGQGDDTDEVDEGEACFADVTCLDDCVTYSWSFVDLHNLLEKVCNIVVLSVCLSVCLLNGRDRSATYADTLSV